MMVQISWEQADELCFHSDLYKMEDELQERIRSVHRNRTGTHFYNVKS